ncbi:hypothetical protein V9K67_17440 [Paraflavisolibacter sp. H34]|uniref:hypothetical protein n=1 Tax=Huijunlia imazamoxiresistens TaxID=3127457 RepID=UPI003019E85A
MKKILSLLPVFLVLFSCKKKDALSQATQPEPIGDSALYLTTAAKLDINDFDLTCQVNVPENEAFSKVWLQWSPTADFNQGYDSLLVAAELTAPYTRTVRLSGLHQASQYISRLCATYKNKRLYSPVKEWATDTLKILQIDNGNTSPLLKKEEPSNVYTNFKTTGYNEVKGTKVYLGPYACTVNWDMGSSINFSVPGSVPAGKYMLQLERKGLKVQSGTSIELLMGKWTQITAPALPRNNNTSTYGLYSFGSCSSSQKGFLVGGALFNGHDGPDGSTNGFLYEFDLQREQWTKKTTVNPRYFEKPTCFYYNNNIYVLGGIEINYKYKNNIPVDPQRGFQRIMWRLDLGTSTWHAMDSLPYQSIDYLAGFELNNEFYIGMGANWDSLSICCGDPLPYKKFWKFSPTASRWTRLADFPGALQRMPTCFSLGEKGYAFYGAVPVGDPGYTTTFTQQFWQYDPEQNAWRQLLLPALGGPLPGEKYQIITYNNKAYFLTAQKYHFFGLWYGYEMQNSCLEYDPANGTFSPISSMRNPRILKSLGNRGNKFYFQTDALGSAAETPNETYTLDLE